MMEDIRRKVDRILTVLEGDSSSRGLVHKLDDLGEAVDRSTNSLDLSDKILTQLNSHFRCIFWVCITGIMVLLFFAAIHIFVR